MTKVREWIVTHSWTGQKVQVFAPTRTLEKIEGARLTAGSAAWYGAMTARLVRANKTTKEN